MECVQNNAVEQGDRNTSKAAQEVNIQNVTSSLDASEEGCEIEPLEVTREGQTGGKQLTIAASHEKDSAVAMESEENNAGGSTTQTAPDPDSAPALPDPPLSKNKLRKLRRYERVAAGRKKGRQTEKRRRRERHAALRAVMAERGEEVASKRDLQRLALGRLQEANRSGVRVCVDCHYTNGRMSDKELARLALQLGRIYGANRRAARPFRLHFTNLPDTGAFYRVCCAKLDGFQRYLVQRSASRPAQLFPAEQLVYLTPDADEDLLELSEDRVYVIGGLVDETVQSGLSRAEAERTGVKTVRLPIRRYLQGPSGPRACILTVNQVMDVLLAYWDTKDWPTALMATIPTRKGFTPRSVVGSEDAGSGSVPAAATAAPPIGDPPHQ